MQRRQWSFGIVLTAAALGVSACGPEDSAGSGRLVITITGEDGAKEGFPVVDEGETIAFADGWTLSFSKYLVSVGNISLKAGTETAVESTETFIADLTKGDPEFAVFEGLAAQRWDNFSYELPPAKAGAKNVNGVAAVDLERMVAGGFNYWFEGSATKGDDTFTFAWGLKNPTRNAACTNGNDAKDGVVIANNSTTEAVITLHVEHAFWDTLGAEEASIRFDAIAARADAQNVVAFDALSTQPLAQPTDAEGNPIKDSEGNNVSYNPGTVQLSENNLKGFILASASSQAHLNGAGLCTTTALPQ